MTDMIEKIVLEAIPHRPPFLFVDCVKELSGERIIAERKIRSEEFYFKGHYPQFPIMPGVLLCESVFQTAGIFLAEKLKSDPSLRTKIPVLVRVAETKFKRMVYPEDTISLEANFIESLKGFYFFKGSVRKNEQLVLTTEFSLSLVDSIKK